MKVWNTILVILFLLTACAPLSSPSPSAPVAALLPSSTPSTLEEPTAPEPDPTAAPERQPVWWETAVFYEIFMRSFNDSDGDGIGDFNGITAKLDYLNDGDPNTSSDLGITALWLMPVFPSPSYHGYDVTDYYAVNPQYGTLDDFKRLLQEAKKRGIRVVIDLVLNHTSSLHPWFVQADADPQSPYRDWYVWSDQDPGASMPGWRSGQTAYYYAYFDPGMPDLNYHNPAVTEEITRIVTFWLKEVGVDGFRIDAAKHLFEDGAKRENVPETYAWFTDFFSTLKTVNPQAFAVGEVYGAGALLVSSYTGDKLDMVFNFEVAGGIVNSVKGESSSGVASAIKFTLMDMPSWQFATFLTNHDQDRVMNVLGGSEDKAKTAATILLSLPGTPFIYYGEEIGMQGAKPDEDIRRPMQWSGDGPNAGFTTGEPWRLPDAANLAANVQAETADPNSLFHHYRRLIALRQKYLSTVNPQVELVSSSNPGLYALLRVQEQGSVLVLVNLTGAAISDYKLSISTSALADGIYSVIPLWDAGDPSSKLQVAAGIVPDFHPLEVLAPYSTHIFQLK